MVFREKYELLALRGGDNEFALPGREILSTRPVVVHLLTGGNAHEDQELLRALHNLPADHRGHLLETGDHNGIPYVVTDPLPDDASLRSWVASAVAATPPQSGESVAQANAPSAGPGEFTRLFQPAATPAEPDAAKPEIGEFTRLFSTPTAEPAQPREAAAPSAPPQKERVASAAAGASRSLESTTLFEGRVPSPTPQHSAPGEFTQAMRPPLAPESSYSKPLVPAAPPQSEFTRMMEGNVLPKPPVARQNPLPQAQVRESPQSQGEFTRLFEAEPAPTGNLAAPAALQTPLPQGGPATGLFSRHAAPAGSDGPPGQSEFTKMISVSSPPPVAATPKPPQPAAGRVPAAVKANRSYLPLVLILGGLFLLAVMLILIFALTR